MVTAIRTAKQLQSYVNEWLNKTLVIGIRFIRIEERLDFSVISIVL